MQIFRYALIGIVGTAAHYLVLIAGVELMGSVLIFTSVGFIVGALVNHHLNRRYTFSSDKTYVRTLLESLNVATFMFFVNLFCMYLLTEFSQLDYRLSQIFTTMITFFAGFFLNKYFVFKKAEA